ncbi:MAG TPA: hypothetical protein VMY37_25545 [Thermoguttaceae bacterium]|nr:hypothetical protein [Thermoguttaceae bacterium]
MTPTDTSEGGLEALITRSLVNETECVKGNPQDYDREHAVDFKQLLAFLQATQPDVVDQLNLESVGPSRTQFLHRVQRGIAKRGVIGVLRKGIKEKKRNGGRTHCFVFSELDEFSGGREGGALTQSPDDVPSF